MMGSAGGYYDGMVVSDDELVRRRCSWSSMGSIRSIRRSESQQKLSLELQPSLQLVASAEARLTNKKDFQKYVQTYEYKWDFQTTSSFEAKLIIEEEEPPKPIYESTLAATSTEALFSSSDESLASSSFGNLWSPARRTVSLDNLSSTRYSLPRPRHKKGYLDSWRSTSSLIEQRNYESDATTDFSEYENDRLGELPSHFHKKGLLKKYTARYYTTLYPTKNREKSLQKSASVTFWGKWEKHWKWSILNICYVQWFNDSTLLI